MQRYETDGINSGLRPVMVANFGFYQQGDKSVKQELLLVLLLLLLLFGFQ
jgi:hypothetical protein